MSCSLRNGIDETLLEARRVTAAQPDDEGLGYAVELSCGHAIWCAAETRAGDRMVCGACLNALIFQIREVQARQRID